MGASVTGTRYFELLRSVTDGLRQRAEAYCAQPNRTVEVRSRQMHYGGGRSAIVTLGRS